MSNIAGIGFKFDVYGEKQFNKFFQRVPESLQDFSLVFQSICDSLREYEKARFAAEGNYQELPRWAELTSPYKEIKAKKYGEIPILQLPDQWLLKSMTQKGFSSPAGEHIEEISEQSMTFGTSVFYALYHQTGTVKMVARPPLLISDEEKRKWIYFFRIFIHNKRIELQKGLK